MKCVGIFGALKDNEKKFYLMLIEKNCCGKHEVVLTAVDENGERIAAGNLFAINLDTKQAYACAMVNPDLGFPKLKENRII